MAWLWVDGQVMVWRKAINKLSGVVHVSLRFRDKKTRTHYNGGRRWDLDL